MRNIATLLDTASLGCNQATEQAPSQHSMTGNDAKVINVIFTEMQACFPAWRYTFPNQETIDQAKKTWAKALIENGVTSRDQVTIGVRKARKSTSPHFPSVGQFIEWCNPTLDDYGLPDERTAFEEACKNSHGTAKNAWSHPAVYVAGRETGFYLLKSKTEAQTYPIFKARYKRVCALVLEGEDFTGLLPKALPPPLPSEPAKPETITKHLTQLKQLMA